MTKEIAGYYKTAYHEADWIGRLNLLYLLVVAPAVLGGSLVYLARV